MITDMEKSFEEISEIYGGFPLKDNFLEAGNAAIAVHGAAAELVDDKIRIHYLSRQFYTEEELDDFRDNGDDEDLIGIVSKWLLKADALIVPDQNPKNGILEADYECWAEGPDEYDEVYPYDQITGEEVDLALKVIEDFLNAAVSAE